MKLPPPGWSAFLAAVAANMLCAAEAELFDESRLEKEVLVTGLHDCVQLQIAPNGDVYYIERAGAVKVFSPANKITRAIGMVPVMPLGEGHMTGIALDPAFSINGWIYLYFSPKIPGNVMRLSRFTLAAGLIDVDSEKVLIEQPFMRGGHFGGGMQLDAAGDLWLSIGDNAGANITPATDERPGRENYNALGTAANSQDLRGKIIRIRPQPDGTYAIPTGNLFPDRKDGRPEIYIMGCRNPYRFYFDSRNGALYWAEIGSNTEERFGNGGYDEITRTVAPGNSGWPLFNGPNTAYVRYDHATNTIGEKYSVDRPVNESRLNTGLRGLPKPIPALIWYGSEDSKEFPELGNGGRSAMVGFVYHFDPALPSPTKLPAHFDGRLFIYDWCRNWIKTVALDASGGVTGIQPFLGATLFRRPIDLKLGPDGALYMVEYGEKWHDNADGVLSRIVYRRGNRPPAAVATATALAGAAPLEVRFSAGQSSDPDGDALSFRWKFGGHDAAVDGPEAKWLYRHPGIYAAELTVTDCHGLSHMAALRIAVGNAPPIVRIHQPQRGAFFDWGEKLPYEIEVHDAEDGKTANGTIRAADVRLRWEYRERPDAAAAEIGFDGGAGLIRRSVCLTCHTLAMPSVGPPFMQVAEKYRTEPEASAKLTEKVLKGGSGAWGEVPMPPHPQHTPDEVALMVEYILGLGRNDSAQRLSGTRGDVTTKSKPPRLGGGTHVLTASYTDRSVRGVPALTGEAKIIVHARQKRAAWFDESCDVNVMEVATLIRQRRVCVQFSAGSYISFKEVNLAGISRVHCEIAASAGHGGVLEFRVDRPDGPLVGRVEVPATGQWDNWKTVTANLRDPGGVHDLFIVGRNLEDGKRKRFNLDVLAFE